MLAGGGFDLHIRAVGNRAVREALDALEQLPKAPDARHQIAHIDLIDDQDMSRLGALGLIANVSPMWAREDKVLVETKLPYLTQKQARLHFAFESLQSAGAELPFGSDWPVSSPDPLWALHVAVNRTAPRDDPARPG
jgi:predicted amidohydrolase YtcJ